jgi:hypothetical protein
MSEIPYTHWFYFPTEERANDAADELKQHGFLTGVDPREDEWLMRAAKSVDVDDLLDRHDSMEMVAERHGGQYDGGESGWLALA